MREVSVDSAVRRWFICRLKCQAFGYHSAFTLLSSQRTVIIAMAFDPFTWIALSHIKGIIKSNINLHFSLITSRKHKSFILQNNISVSIEIYVIICLIFLLHRYWHALARVKHHYFMITLLVVILTDYCNCISGWGSEQRITQSYLLSLLM